MTRIQLVAMLIGLAACSGSHTPGPGVERDAGVTPPADGAVSSDGGDVCASAREGAACSTPGVMCGGEGCGDVCSFCNLLGCLGGTWQNVEASPLPCFPCGESQCVIGDQYCRIVHDDTGLPPSYDCLDTPAGCDPVGCMCLEAAVHPNTCTEGENGAVVVEYYGG